VRWLVDECVDAGLVTDLRAAGHDVVYIAEVAVAALDGEIIRLANADDRLLLTDDKDFGDLVFHRGASVPGVVLLRLHPALHALKRRRLRIAIERIGERMFGRYTIVEEARFRSRPLRR
jgi:predicted nuclease of predicted toxin-antitoxin system